MTWRDIPGSKLTPRHVIRAAFDLFRIYRAYRCNQVELDGQDNLNADGSEKVNEKAA
jgi:hypothetical protein